MEEKLTKEQAEQLLLDTVKKINDSGIKLYVASDDEGNAFNLIEQEYMIFGGTKKDCIVLGTCGYVDGEDIFDFDGN